MDVTDRVISRRGLLKAAGAGVAAYLVDGCCRQRSDGNAKAERPNIIYILADDLGYALHNIEEEQYRREAEKALVESEERFRRISEVAQDMIYAIKLYPRFHIDYVSPSIQALLGYSFKEVSGDPLWLFKTVHPDDLAMVPAVLLVDLHDRLGPSVAVVDRRPKAGHLGPGGRHQRQHP